MSNGWPRKARVSLKQGQVRRRGETSKTVDARKSRGRNSRRHIFRTSRRACRAPSGPAPPATQEGAPREAARERRRNALPAVYLRRSRRVSSPPDEGVFP